MSAEVVTTGARDDSPEAVSTALADAWRIATDAVRQQADQLAQVGRKLEQVVMGGASQQLVQMGRKLEQTALAGASQQHTQAQRTVQWASAAFQQQGQQLAESVRWLSAAFQQQSEQLTRYDQALAAELAPHAAELTRLAELVSDALDAAHDPERLRQVLHLLRQRRQHMHDGLAAVLGDDLDALVATGTVLLAHVTRRTFCRHHQRTDAPGGRSAPLALHMAAHAPPTRTRHPNTTTHPGVP
jgi:hypothetical protein